MTGGIDQVLTRVEASVGFVTQNRPKAINALTHEMATAPHAVLVEWASDPAITAVVLDALAVTLESVRRAADLPTLKDVLLQEYRVACAALDSRDFVEGIRAQVIDKDRNPKWSPSSASDITAADVNAYFANAGNDLKFDVDMES